MIGRAWLLALAAGLAAPLLAAPAHDHAAAPDPPRDAKAAREAMWARSLARPALAVGAAFDARGRLWLARVDNGRLRVSHSTDAGRSFSEPVAVNTEPEHIAADGENRPKLAFGPQGEVYVSWTQPLPEPYSGHVRFARSLDGGRTFSAPVTVNDNREAISHRFESLLVLPDGRVQLVWLDRRDAAAAKRAGETYTGIALYSAVSTDRGASFAANRKLADHSCECCRIAFALDTDGTPITVWRQVFGANLRDHALLRLDGKSSLTRVSHENWAVDACPHHGPALAIGTDGVWHLAWYSGAEQKRGLFYVASRDRGRSFDTPRAFGDNDAQAGHPQVLSLGATVYLAWKEFDGREARVRAQRSRDAGRSWDPVQTLAATAGASDHPLLVSDGARGVLVWNSAADGLRVLPLPETAP